MRSARFVPASSYDEPVLPAAALAEAALDPRDGLVAEVSEYGCVVVRAARRAHRGTVDASTLVRQMREEDLAVDEANERRRAQEAEEASEHDVAVRSEELRAALGR